MQKSLLGRLVGYTCLVLCGVLFTISLFPFVDRQVAKQQAKQLSNQAQKMIQQTSCHMREQPDPRLERLLSSWGNIGGCGVGGGVATGGGVKWIGRGVTGGLMDIQCSATEILFLDGAQHAVWNTRIGTSYFEKWNLALTMPFSYKVEQITAADALERWTHLPGWGDLGLEVTRKLGITNAHSLSLSLTTPTGSYDAVRQGVILPQRQQLGAGVPTATLTYEFFRDADWGLMIFGGNVSYGGWQNQIDDLRSSSLSGYSYFGYLLGPFVPSAGLILTGKLFGEKERGETIADQAKLLVIPSFALEWSSDYLALLAQIQLPMGLDGFQSFSFSLGAQTSLF